MRSNHRVRRRPGDPRACKERTQSEVSPSRASSPHPRYAEQPALAAILKLVQSQARGLEPHTVRSVLSRLGSKGGLVLTRTKDEAEARVSAQRRGGPRKIPRQHGLSGGPRPAVESGRRERQRSAGTRDTYGAADGLEASNGSH
jgi:hypothetical protein